MYLRPVDLVLRAILEVTCAIGLVAGSLAIVSGTLGLSLAVAAPLAAAALWATFRVPGDPGPSPWPTPGPVRLVLELVLLGLGAAGWMLAGRLLVGLLLGALIAGHYLMTAERGRWMLDQR